MKDKLSVSPMGWLLYSVWGLALAVDVAVAQQASDVVIQSDRPVVSVQRPTRGSVVRVVSLSERVGYGDLNLDTPAGAAQLEKRVGDAVASVCKKLDQAYPDSSPRGRACARNAFNDAMLKVRASARVAEHHESAPSRGS